MATIKATIWLPKYGYHKIVIYWFSVSYIAATLNSHKLVFDKVYCDYLSNHGLVLSHYKFYKQVIFPTFHSLWQCNQLTECDTS